VVILSETVDAVLATKPIKLKQGSKDSTLPLCCYGGVKNIFIPHTI